MSEKKEESYEEWKAGFDGLSFEESAIRLKDKLLESPEFDKTSRKYFQDAFNYVLEQYRLKKPLSTALLKIHLVDIKGYKQLTIEELSRILVLLSLCGFEFKFDGKIF